MKKILIAVLGSLVVLATAAAQKDTKSTRVTCTLTSKTVEKCCCVQQQDGKLYCTLAKKAVDHCCCKPAEK